MKSTILSILLLTSSLTFAGGRDSGGGSGTVCRDSNRNVTWAELSDLFDGSRKHKLTVSPSSGTEKEELKKALLNAKKISVGFAEILRDTIRELNMEPLENGVSMSPSNDYGKDPVYFRTGCPPEQVAYYQDGKILVDTDITAKFSNKSNAALKMHEAVYKLFREKAGDETSYRSRRFTVGLFAENATTEQLKEWSEPITKGFMIFEASRPLHLKLGPNDVFKAVVHNPNKAKGLPFSLMCSEKMGKNYLTEFMPASSSLNKTLNGQDVETFTMTRGNCRFLYSAVFDGWRLGVNPAAHPEHADIGDPRFPEGHTGVSVEIYFNTQKILEYSEALLNLNSMIFSVAYNLYDLNESDELEFP